VLDRKKAAQLASIAACALEGRAVPEPPDVVGDALADEDDGEEDEEDEGDELGCELELPLLPQAATAMPATAPRAGTRRK
jgi:hypothetical protein